MRKGLEPEELEELERLLADFEGLSHAVEGHANYKQLLGDHPTAESSVSNSKRVAKEAWQLFHLLGAEEPPSPFDEFCSLKI